MRGGEKTGLRPPAARQCVIRKSVVIIELGHGKKVCGNASRASFTNGSIAGSGSGNAPPFQPVSCMFGNIFIVAYEKASLPRPATVFSSSSSFFPLQRCTRVEFFQTGVCCCFHHCCSFSLPDRREKIEKNLSWSHQLMNDLLETRWRELLNYKSFKCDRGDGIFCFLSCLCLISFVSFENITIPLILHHVYLLN